ncbi:hypothetical protein SAMN05421690_10557 [Nitrosomonas sp. Nm51]|nr:hypothetical protein SAMN05421690_10557 [Nitrosomonas sp. Nm51]
MEIVFNAALRVRVWPRILSLLYKDNFSVSNNMHKKIKTFLNTEELPSFQLRENYGKILGR